MTDGRDVWWHDLVPGPVERVPRRSRWIPKTCCISSTRAAPPRSRRGSCTRPAVPRAGRVDAQARLRPEARHRRVLVRGRRGWVTGHSYIVYGPLANRATSVLYEGTPDHPTKDRSGRSSTGTASRSSTPRPTTIRTFMKWGDRVPAGRSSGSLRLLGTVGEPINPEAWVWYWKHIGHERCPVVDTWWQTETGAIMVSPLPGCHHAQAGFGDVPDPGWRRRSSTTTGRWSVVPGGGYLTLARPVAVDAARHLG